MLLQLITLLLFRQVPLTFTFPLPFFPSFTPTVPSSKSSYSSYSFSSSASSFTASYQRVQGTVEREAESGQGDADGGKRILYIWSGLAIQKDKKTRKTTKFWRLLGRQVGLLSRCFTSVFECFFICFNILIISVSVFLFMVSCWAVHVKLFFLGFHEHKPFFFLLLSMCFVLSVVC